MKRFLIFAGSGVGLAAALVLTILIAMFAEMYLGIGSQ